MEATIDQRIFSTLVASVEASTITLGYRLGIWDLLDSARPSGLSAAEVAQRCEIHPRYAREWLEAMGSAGLLTFVRASAPGKESTFSMVDGVRAVLVDSDSNRYLMPLLRQAVTAASMMRPLEAAYRSGGGVAWAEHDEDMRLAQGECNKAALLGSLPSWVTDFLPAVGRRLAGGGRVADVGCGDGWAAIGIAAAFPSATVDAFDLDDPTVRRASANVEEAGLRDRVTVHHRAIGGDRARYDLVVLAEMLHDVPDPVGVLAASRDALTRGGVALVVDMKAGDSYSAPGDESERLLYGYSLLVCLPDAMSHQPSAATGTVIRPAVVRSYAGEAGFTHIRELDIPHDGWRFWSLSD